MADPHPASILSCVRKLASSPQTPDVSDACLLERYIQQRDEAAFAALVRRHGPLVWRISRRLLRQSQDAEEVYQATFLVLARRAAKIRKPAALASFLYSVAYRIARKVRADLLHRQTRRNELDMEPFADPASEAAWLELESILLEEVHALSEKYRTPILLCYWEGLTNEEASQRLGWPVGTVKTRLLKARQLLHERLTRRGVSLSTGAIVTLLASSSGDAAVLPLLARGAILAAMGNTSGVTARAVALAEQAILNTIGAKAKGVAALLLLVGGTAALAYHAMGERQAEEKQIVQTKEAALLRPAKAKPQKSADFYGDPLPPGAVARLGTRRLCGAMDSMWLRFSPDGLKIASHGLFYLTVWDARSGKRLVERDNYNPLVNGLAWRKNETGVAIVRLPDHSYFVSEFTNADEKLPNPLPAPLKGVPASGPDGLEALALSPDGTRLAIVRDPAEESINIELLTVATGRLVGDLKREKTLGPFEGPCEEVRYTDAGQLMILSSSKKRKSDWFLTIVDPETNRVVRTARIPPPGFCVWKYMLSLSADGRLAAIPPRGSGSTNDHDGTIRVWDLDAGKEIWSFPYPQFFGYGCCHAFTTDGKRLITSASKRYFQIWNLTTGKEEAGSTEQSAAYRRQASAVAMSADGKRFATARQSDGRVDIWDTQTGKPVIELATHRDAIVAVAVSPEGNLAATLGRDGLLRTWGLVKGQPMKAIPAPLDEKRLGPFQPLRGLTFTPDGRGLFFRGSDELMLVDPKTGKALSLPAPLRNRRDHVGGFSADGRTLATISGDKVTLWDWPTTSIRTAFTVPLNPQRPAGVKNEGPETVVVNSVALSNDGRLVFTNSTRRLTNPPHHGYQNSNDVWDGRTGKHLHRLTAPQTEHPPGVFSPDGRVLYVGGHSLDFRERRTADALTAWDPTTGSLLRRLAEPRQEAKRPPRRTSLRMVGALAVSPDGRLLAVAEQPYSPGNLLRLYETASGGILKELVGHDRSVTDMAFTPDGRRLVTVSEDQTGLIWDVTPPALGDAGAKLLPQVWDALAASDPKLGYNAVAALTANPREAIALLRKQLRAAPVPTDADLDRLVGQLDADSFAERQKAMAELERFGPNAVAGVKARLKQSPPLEVRKRLLLFLEKHDGPNPHQFRCARAVAALEAIEAPEARALLAELAKGPSTDVLTREAQAAIRRAGR
jgi:RNA polymerase sigma factor (sigma-70 family)